MTAANNKSTDQSGRMWTFKCAGVSNGNIAKLQFHNGTHLTMDVEDFILPFNMDSGSDSTRCCNAC